MSYLKTGDYWPPAEEDRNRIEKYLENKQLFKGQHDEVFKKVQRRLESQDQNVMTYLVTNYCGLLSKLSADMLFGENPKFKAENDNTNNRLQELISENKLYTSLYESALGNSYRGDACYKVRYAKRSKYAEERSVIIETQNPNYFFVEQADDDVRQINRQIIGWDFMADTDNDGIDDIRYLKLEVHEPGTIYNSLYQLSGGTINKEISLDTLYPDLKEVQKTGINDFLITHIPNWRDDEEFWGYSDYLDMKSLQDECNNRISQISRVLDMHADPKMKGPTDALDEEGQIDVSGNRFFPYDKDSAEPAYITWEAKLEMAFKQVDYMLKMMFLVTETSPDAFGLSESSTAESGRALKYKLMRLLSKIARKKRYYDTAIKDVLYKAQLMDIEHNNQSYEPEVPSATWRDGIPDDPLEKANITETLDRAGSMSIEEKVHYNHPDWSEQRIQEEIGRIETERAEAQSTAPFTI